MRKICIFVFSIVLTSKAICQDNTVNYPYQSVFVGFSHYSGYLELKDAFRWNASPPTNSLMRYAAIPNIGVSHRFSQKLEAFAKIGYGFIKSTGIDTIIDNSKLVCERKIRDLKLDAEVMFYALIKRRFGVALSGELGYNFLTEKYSCMNDRKYSNIGFGGGLHLFYGYSYNYYASFSLNIYKIGKHNFVGGGIKIPIWNNMN